MKSAYELALERMSGQGVDAPSATALSDEQKAAIAEVRSLYASKVAELEILHRDQMRKLTDPLKRDEQEEFYRRERQSLAADEEKRVGAIRGA